ncbi:unnamed protein product [Rhizophagus irregularis]|nr:unnamed protein product [Rhizophagus irregularis]
MNQDSFRLRVGYIEFGFRFLGLDIWNSAFGSWVWIYGYMDFFRFLGVGYIGFDFWFLGFEYKDFGFRLLGVGYMGFVFRLLGVGYTGFDFQFSGFRYVGFDFRFSFGLLLNGFLFRTLSDRFLGIKYTGFDFQFLGFGYVSTFSWVLDIWISAFEFGFRFLGLNIWISAFGSWALDVRK